MTEEQKCLRNEEKSKKFKTIYEHYSIVAYFSVVSGGVDMKNNKFAKYYNALSYFFFFYFASSYGILIHSVFVNVFTNNIIDALKQFSILNLIVLSSVKTILRIVHKRKIFEILNEVNKDYEDANNLEEEYQIVMEKTIQDNKFTEKFWVFQSFSVAMCILSKPLYEMMQSALTENIFTRRMLFEVTFPFINDIKMISPIYETLALYTLFQILFMANIFMSFDPVFLILIIHSCANLEIAKSLLRDLFMHEAVGYDATRVRLKMKRIVILHQKTIKCAITMQSIYWPFIFITFLISTLVICGTLYMMISSLENGIFPYEIMALFLAPIINVYVLSFYGEKIVEKSQEVGDAAYFCGWENYPDSSIRKSISLIIMRSQHPLRFSSKFSYLSMASFSTIIQTSWSYFTLMRSAGD